MNHSLEKPGLGLRIRSALFWVVFFASTIVLAPIIVLLFFLPFRMRYAVANLWSRVNLRWLELTCGLRYEIEGRENIPTRNAIVFSKHQSTWETLALQEMFPAQVWVLKRELMRVPFFGWALALLKPIAIDRGAGRKAVEQLIEQGKQRLREGLWVIIFPEGTRTAPGTRNKYRIGGAVLAEASTYPVVPVAHNAGEYWPRHSFVKYPGTIRVVIGAPIVSEGRTAAEILSDAEDWIEARVAEISTEK